MVRPGRTGQLQPAADVVVVDVGLQHVGDPKALGAHDVEHPIDIALRVDRERGRAVVDQVAVIAQAGRVNDNDLRGHRHRRACRHRRPVAAHLAARCGAHQVGL
jgi:hypothetical protein